MTYKIKPEHLLANYWHLKVTTLLYISNRWNLYLQLKHSKYTLERRSFCINKGRPLVKLMMIVVSDRCYILDILGLYLADGKNIDAALLNRHLLKDCDCILALVSNGMYPIKKQNNA